MSRTKIDDSIVDSNGKRSFDDSPLGSMFSCNSETLPGLRQPKDLLPSNTSATSATGNYRWQGIEAILESYQRHIEGNRHYMLVHCCVDCHD